MTLKIESTAFAADGEIPVRYTGEGEDLSPPLSWSGVPSSTKSLVLLVDDPDAPDPAAPKMVWVHWVLYNIPPSVTGLSEGVKSLPVGTGEGLNDWKRTGYGGPLPPIGRHRYFHKLYALDGCCQTKRAGAGFALAAFPISGSSHRFLEQTQDKTRRPGTLDIRPFA